MRKVLLTLLMEKQTQRGLVLAELTSVELGFDFSSTLKVLKTYVLFLIPFHRVFSFRDVAANLPALPSMSWPPGIHMSLYGFF